MTEALVDTSSEQMDKTKVVWQEYLQKCCEYGQIQHALDQLESQRKEMEKKLDMTLSQAKKAAIQHRELQKAMADKIQLPKAEETIEAH